MRISASCSLGSGKPDNGAALHVHGVRHPPGSLGEDAGDRTRLPGDRDDEGLLLAREHELSVFDTHALEIAPEDAQ